jgi:hypothetical protein
MPDAHAKHIGNALDVEQKRQAPRPVRPRYRNLTPSAWVDDVSALVLRGRPGGTIHQRIRRLCQRCRDTAVR